MEYLTTTNRLLYNVKSYLLPNMHNLLFQDIYASVVTHDFKPWHFKPWQRSKIFYLQNTNPLRVPNFKRLEMRVWFLPLEQVFVLVPRLAYIFYLRKVCDDVLQTRKSTMQTIGRISKFQYKRQKRAAWHRNQNKYCRSRVSHRCRASDVFCLIFCVNFYTRLMLVFRSLAFVKLFGLHF